MPWRSTRPRGSTVNPIYRTPIHRRARAALVAKHRPGDPCCLCGHPMWSATSKLHADHDPSDPSKYRGLAHGSEPCQDCGRRCNVVDGARRGNRRSRSRRLVL